MDSLTVKNISFRDVVVPKALEVTVEILSDFSYDFIFGKSYLLAGERGQGGWALSWIIGGLLKPNSGEVLRNNIPYNLKARRKDVWCPFRSEVKRFGLFTMSVKQQIQQGFQTVQNQYLPNEKAIVERFHLSPQRYNHPLWRFSLELWWASCAIGLAHNKKIFCFPQMGYEIEESHQGWFKDMIDLLRDTGALVIVPAKLTPKSSVLCDEIVKMDSSH